MIIHFYLMILLNKSYLKYEFKPLPILKRLKDKQQLKKIRPIGKK